MSLNRRENNLNEVQNMKTVKVIFENGNSITTQINGTVEEIKEYYAIGTPFNIGSVDDNIQKIKSVIFLD